MFDCGHARNPIEIRSRMTSISCIIVCYNNEQYIGHAIESVLSQTKPLDEIIIADDCSTDRSREIILSYANNYSVICPVLREKNLGVGANRDLAIRNSNANIITALDGDDWYYPDKIEKEYLALRENNVVAYSDISLMHNEYEQVGCWNMSGFPGADIHKRLKWITLRKPPIPTHMMLPKKVYEESGGMKHNVNLYEDWDFKIRLSGLPYKWVYSGTTGMAYRQKKGGLSSAHLLKHLAAQLHTLQYNKDLLLQHYGQHGYTYILTATILRIVKRTPKRIFKAAIQKLTH